MSKPRTSVPPGEAQKNVVANAKRLRLASGLSARDLAVKLREQGRPLTVSSGWTKVECGFRHLSLDDFAALLRIFNVPAEELLTAPSCDACLGVPPPGFTCNACGKGTPQT